MIRDFTGKAKGVDHLNELVRAVNALLTYTGDQFLLVQKTDRGMTIKLNWPLLLSRLPHSASGGGGVGGGGTSILHAYVRTTPIVTDKIYKLKWGKGDAWENGEDYALNEFTEWEDSEETMHDYRCLVAHKSGGGEAWDSEKQYQAGNRVWLGSPNDDTYKAKVTPVIGHSPATYPAEWELDNDNPTGASPGNHWATYWAKDEEFDGYFWRMQSTTDKDVIEFAPRYLRNDSVPVYYLGGNWYMNETFHWTGATGSIQQDETTGRLRAVFGGIE